MLRGYRMTDKALRATKIAPGVEPLNFNIDVGINDFHYSFGHVHERLLRETAKQRNANLTRTLWECEGYSIAKGSTKHISTTTGTRAAKPDGTGSMLSISCAAKTRFPDTSRQYLADYRFTGVPCPVETVRTDDAAKFKGRAFADLYRERGIRQKFTTADSPQFNSVAERGIAMVIESAGKAAIIQAGLNFPGMGIPSGNSLWADQAYWACHALNSTATTSNPQCMTPYEM